MTARKLRPFRIGGADIGPRHDLDHGGAHHAHDIAEIVEHHDGDRQHQLLPDRPAGPLVSSGEVPGSQPSQMTKMLARNTPEANSGTDVVTMLATEMVRSSIDPSRMPAAMPKMIESGTMTAKGDAGQQQRVAAGGPR